MKKSLMEPKQRLLLIHVPHNGYEDSKSEVAECKERFMDKFAEKLKKLHLKLDEDVKLHMNALPKDGYEAETTLLVKVTFTAKMADRRVDMMEVGDFLDSLDQGQDLPPFS